MYAHTNTYSKRYAHFPCAEIQHFFHFGTKKLLFCTGKVRTRIFFCNFCFVVCKKHQTKRKMDAYTYWQFLRTLLYASMCTLLVILMQHDRTVYIYIIYIYIYMCIYIHIHMCVCVYIYIYIHICVFMYIHIYVYIYLYIYIYIYSFVHTYI